MLQSFIAVGRRGAGQRRHQAGLCIATVLCDLRRPGSNAARLALMGVRTEPTAWRSHAQTGASQGAFDLDARVSGGRGCANSGRISPVGLKRQYPGLWQAESVSGIHRFTAAMPDDAGLDGTPSRGVGGIATRRSFYLAQHQGWAGFTLRNLARHFTLCKRNFAGSDHSSTAYLTPKSRQVRARGDHTQVSLHTQRPLTKESSAHYRFFSCKKVFANRFVPIQIDRCWNCQHEINSQQKGWWRRCLR